jgi:hypothetical protein
MVPPPEVGAETPAGEAIRAPADAAPFAPPSPFRDGGEEKITMSKERDGPSHEHGC